MHLSIATWSLPHCTLDECAAITRALGVGALDLGLFYRAALDKARLLADPLAVAAQVRALGVNLPNYYHLFGDSLSDRNLAQRGTTAANLADLERVLTFADAAGISTVFILPGVVNAGQSRAQAATVATDSLRALMGLARDFKARLCVEPHVHSWAESPALVETLVEQTGVGLCLDYAHFACLGYRQEEIDPLARHALHIHLRQARMGALQAKFAQGTLNFPAMFATLRDAGYQGAMTLENVHQDYMNTLSEDVLTEMILMRDCYNAWKEGA
jgi:sugar phosphate isomerase/epimerase